MSAFVHIGKYLLDVSLSEDHTFESDVTDYPVESGGSVSDNIRPKPIKVSIKGVITDTPLASNINSQGLNGLEFAELVQEEGFDNAVQFLPSQLAYEFLKTVWQSQDVVQIRTSMGTFENMAMTSLEIPRSKETTGGLQFTATLQQIQKVTNGRLKKTAIRNGGGKNKHGAQGGVAPIGPRVLWRKANPAGSDNIIVTYELAFSWDNKTPATTPPVWIYINGPFGAPEYNALIPSEIAWFNKDMERDRFDRHFGLLTAEQINGNWTVNRWTNTPYRSKTAQADLSNRQREAFKAGQAGASSGDPKFGQKGNFVSTDPKPKQKKPDLAPFIKSFNK